VVFENDGVEGSTLIEESDLVRCDKFKVAQVVSAWVCECAEDRRQETEASLTPVPPHRLLSVLTFHYPPCSPRPSPSPHPSLLHYPHSSTATLFPTRSATSSAMRSSSPQRGETS
jgi:hypothetical protein